MHICPFPKQVKVSKIFFICLEEKLNFCSIIFFKQNTYVWLTFSQFSNHNCNKKNANCRSHLSITTKPMVCHVAFICRHHCVSCMKVLHGVKVTDDVIMEIIGATVSVILKITEILQRCGCFTDPVFFSSIRVFTLN